MPPICLGAAALTSCGGPGLPQQDTNIVLRAVLTTVAACTLRLDPDGNVSQPALAAMGWTPRSRRVAAMVTRGNSTGMEERNVPPDQPIRPRTVDDYESSQWAHPGWEGMIDVSRQGGAIAERAMGRCGASYAGRDARTADLALAAMTQRLGQPVGRRERPRGGDFLTPRWFEPTVYEVYWRLPSHDVYWVSSNSRMVTVEVRAMPDRNQLDQWSPDRPAEEFRTRESGS